MTIRTPRSNRPRKQAMRLVCILGCATAMALALALATGAEGQENRHREPIKSPDVPVADHELFDRLDRDRDGRLTTDELPAEQSALVKRLIRLGDENGDSTLDRDEWERALRPRRPAKPLEEKQSADLPGADAARLLLLRLDTDKDGRLTRDEAPVEWRRSFDGLAERFDGDKDGIISRLELARGGPQVARLADRLVNETPDAIERQLKRFEREQGELARRFDESPRAPERPMRGQGRALVLFRELDTNKDGMVEIDEVPERLARRTRRWIRQGDTNGDAKLSAEEFQRVFSSAVGREAPSRDAATPGAATGKGVAPK